MTTLKPYHDHLSSSQDLITSYNATRAGFLEMALERNKKANPIINQAKALKAAAQKTSCADELHKISNIKDALLTSAGFSDKAKRYIHEEDKDNLIVEFINKFLLPAGDFYIDELVYRFLLTKGDSIGGSLRNLAGTLAMKKISESVISTLRLFQIPFSWQKKSNKSWYPSKDFDDIDTEIIGLSWIKNGQKRTLLFNRTLPLVGKNIDLCLLNCDYSINEDVLSRSPELIIALGEVKGGIDPAGADEHWKTARTAFTRIRQNFSNIEKFPFTFFIGAAIENSMSIEIWNQLEASTLTNAANLTNADQLASIINWVYEL